VDPAAKDMRLAEDLVAAGIRVPIRHVDEIPDDIINAWHTQSSVFHARLLVQALPSQARTRWFWNRVTRFDPVGVQALLEEGVPSTLEHERHHDAITYVLSTSEEEADLPSCWEDYPSSSDVARLHQQNHLRRIEMVRVLMEHGAPLLASFRHIAKEGLQVSAAVALPFFQAHGLNISHRQVSSAVLLPYVQDPSISSEGWFPGLDAWLNAGANPNAQHRSWHAQGARKPHWASMTAILLRTARPGADPDLQAMLEKAFFPYALRWRPSHGQGLTRPKPLARGLRQSFRTLDAGGDHRGHPRRHADALEHKDRRGLTPEDYLRTGPGGPSNTTSSWPDIDLMRARAQGACDQHRARLLRTLLSDALDATPEEVAPSRRMRL
jgi:hypothetical protein